MGGGPAVSRVGTMRVLEMDLLADGPFMTLLPIRGMVDTEWALGGSLVLRVTNGGRLEMISADLG